MRRRDTQLRIWRRPVAWALLGVLAAAAAAWACDTPVYRYAMYRWLPTPYYVFHLHDGPLSDQDKQVHAALEAAAQREDRPANVLLTDVNLAEDDALSSVPGLVKKLWEERDDKQARSAYLIFNPYGGLVHQGPLASEEVAPLVDSPVRRQLANSLAQGLAAVWVLLKCSDEQANAKAEQELKDLVQAVNTGEIQLYSTPPAYFGPEAEAAEQERGPEHQIAYVTVDRDDQSEAWLVRSLMAVEPDLNEYADEPMAFAIYGRGRAMPPYIGKGITRDNMIDCVDFITGACSCMVKEQNPGVDLLIQCDWDAVAIAVAKKFGAEEGAEMYGGYYSELVVPPTGEAEATGDEEAIAEAEAGEAPPAAAGAPGEPVAQAEPAAEAEGSAADPAAPEPSGDAARSPTGPEPAATALGPSSVTTSPEPAPPRDAAAARATGVGAVAVGVIVGLLILFGATFVVLRPR